MKLSSLMLALICVSCASVFANTLDASAKPNQSVSDFFSQPEISNAILSPSGKYAAILIRSQSGRASLNILDTKTLKSAGTIANYAIADVTHVNWLNDDRLVFAVSDLKDGREHITGDWFAINRDGSDRRQLITGNWDYQQDQTGQHIKIKTLPPDYVFFGTMHNGSDKMIVAKRIFNDVDWSLQSTRLYSLDTKSLQINDLMENDTQPPHITDWVLDRENRPRIATSNWGGRYIVYARDLENHQWREIENNDELNTDGFSPEFFDFNQNFYVHTGNEKGIRTLHQYDLTSKKIEKEAVISLGEFDFLGSPVFDYSAKKLLGYHFVTDADSSAWINPEMKKLQARVDEILPNTTNTIGCYNCLESSTVLVEAASDKQPTEFLLYDRVADKMIKIGGSHPSIEAKNMGSREYVHYTAHDGLSIPAYVTLPPNSGGKNLPTIVFVHGGPYLRGSQWEWDREAQFLATRGYAVIQPEFRGSYGFGAKFYEAGIKQWGLSMQDDLADAAQWAIKQGIADPKRIAIAGASYGGYATLMGLIKNPEIFRCGFEWAGVTDLNLMFTATWSDASYDQQKYGMKDLIGDPVKDAEQIKATSPVTLAAQLRQPLLMAHGGADRRVPIEHGKAFYSAVSEHNPNVEWIVYADEGHGWTFEKDRLDFWNRVEAFLDKNLKNAPVQ